MTIQFMKIMVQHYRTYFIKQHVKPNEVCGMTSRKEVESGRSDTAAPRGSIIQHLSPKLHNVSCFMCGGTHTLRFDRSVIIFQSERPELNRDRLTAPLL